VEPQNPQSSGTRDDTSSDAEFTAEQIPDSPNDFTWFDTPGDIVDGEIVDENTVKSRLKSSDDATDEAVKASAGPPKLDEWMDFFGRVLIRGATDFYIHLAFDGIDEELLTPREVERIKLSKVERERIAKPFAELANKSKLTRKHGRKIIALTGSIDSVIQLGMWISRVNRIAAKYRAITGQTRPSRQFAPPMPREESKESVSARQDTSHVNGDRRARPDIAGSVFNPDLG